MRDVLVSSKNCLVNSVRGYLRQKLRRIQSGTAATLGNRVRQRYAELGEPVPPHLDRPLETIAHLHAAARAATEDVGSWAEQNPVCVRLMTVPGVANITATRFVAAIDRVDRFPSAHKVESYLGLAPQVSAIPAVGIARHSMLCVVKGRVLEEEYCSHGRLPCRLGHTRPE
jgi:transposase